MKEVNLLKDQSVKANLASVQLNGLESDALKGEVILASIDGIRDDQIKRDIYKALRPQVEAADFEKMNASQKHVQQYKNQLVDICDQVHG